MRLQIKLLTKKNKMAWQIKKMSGTYMASKRVTRK